MKKGLSITFTTLLFMINGWCHAQELPLISFKELTKTCATGVHEDTMQALVRVESRFNPYAIGVVNGAIKQPMTFSEAVEAAKALKAEGKNFSMGLGQINIHNLPRYGLNIESVFEPCTNLKTASAILSECYSRATGSAQEALQKALSCYYSGNFRTGFTQDLKGQPSYVDRIKEASLQNTEPTTIQIPKLDPTVKLTTAKVAKPKPTKAKTKVKVDVVPEKAEQEVVKLTQRPKAIWDAFGDW